MDAAAPSPWPAWLRRHTGVEHLGAPRLFFPRLAIALSLLTIVYVGGWNAAKYPVPLGYDAQANADYVHVLLRDHRLPTVHESEEAHQPPGYYALAAVATEAGQKLFGWHEDRGYASLSEVSYRGAQILNVLLELLTAACILWIARVVAPRTPWVWAASVGFFAFLPVVAKTAAMLHPENLNMFSSTLAVAAATHMFVRRDFRRRYMLLMTLGLGIGLASRASSIFTVLAVVLALLVALTIRDVRERFRWDRLLLSIVVMAAIAMPWIAYRAIVEHRGPLNRTSALFSAAFTGRSTAATRSGFWSLPVNSVLSTPWRPNFTNAAPAETYTEIWGDWIGAFAWSPYDTAPYQPVQPILRDQNSIGIAPTLLAIAGWVALAYVAVRRRRDLVVLAALPVVAVTGYLYRSWILLSRDGDVLKATYVLTTVGAWALGFGLATAWLADRSRLVRYGMIGLFAFFAVLELRFTLYGARDHAPPF